jgi:magnesium-transporting ATPase (P-type)
MAPTMALLIWSQLRPTTSCKEAIRVAVGGMVAMIPQGLVLLLSVAFAVGVVRLGRRNVLVQELPRWRASPGSTSSASTRPARSPRAGSLSTR